MNAPGAAPHDEARGTQYSSRVVALGRMVAVSGVMAEPPLGDVRAQTRRALERIDELLASAGTDKSRLLTARVQLSDLGLLEEHNAAWNEWVDPRHRPVRSVARAELPQPGTLVELMVTAAR